MNRFTLLICMFSIFFLGNIATQQHLTEEQKINQLISAVEQLKDVQFYRNGTYYNAKTAADHLRMKRKKAGLKIKSAKDFIEIVGSKSYLTGEEYHIKYADGRKVPTKVFFEQKLKEIK